ncbi:lipid II flippase MurJ [Desulfosarcina alkanivorans]|uniref:lipid II flippase MurJ n=1 Tax=Desulfosarcina alkanivorans TaxID=571177 RepID=UPI002F40D264
MGCRTLTESRRAKVLWVARTAVPPVFPLLAHPVRQVVCFLFAQGQSGGPGLWPDVLLSTGRPAQHAGDVSYDFLRIGRRPGKKNRVYNDLFSLSVFVALPASIFLILMGKDVVPVLLERGVFSSDDTILVYRALAGFSWALFLMIILGPLEQIFQAQGKINLLVWRKVIGMLVNILGNYMFLFVLDWGASESRRRVRSAIGRSCSAALRHSGRSACPGCGNGYWPGRCGCLPLRCWPPS